MYRNLEWVQKNVLKKYLKKKLSNNDYHKCLITEADDFKNVLESVEKCAVVKFN